MVNQYHNNNKGKIGVLVLVPVSKSLQALQTKSYNKAISKYANEK